MNDVVALVKKMLSPVARRVGHMVVRAVVDMVDDSDGMQTAQMSLQADQQRDAVERFQPFGFGSVPDAGAEAIVVHVGGDGDHPIVVVVDDRRYRPTGAAVGESYMYTKQNGLRVYCKADGTVNIGTSPTDFVALKTPTDSNLNNLASWLQGLVALCVPALVTSAPGSPDALAVAIKTYATASPVPTIQSTTASQVKAK